MSDGATIGALRFVLGADSSQLDAATAKASRSLRSAAAAGEAAGAQIANALTRIGGIVAGAFAVDRLIAFATHAIDAGAAIGRFADQAGLSTTAFQELQFALRRTGVEGEQMSAAFAIFGRNLADLHRGTGPLLQFLRESAPQFISQFRAVKDVNEGFTLLTSILSRARHSHDALNMAQKALGEQGAKLAMEAARLGPAFDQARRQAHELGRVLSDEQVRQLRDAKQAWQDFGDRVTMVTGQFIASVMRIATASPRFNSLEELNKALAATELRLSTMGQEALTASGRLDSVWQSAERLTAGVRSLANQPLVLPQDRPDTWTAQQNAVRALQGELAKYMAQLQNLHSLTEFQSTGFAQAWERMRAAMLANNETGSAIAAAQINLLMQEDATRQRLIGNSITLEEEYTRRMLELTEARNRGLITEMDFIGARNRLQVQSSAIVAGALAQATNSLAQAFQGNKAVLVAQTIANTAASIMTTLSTYGYTPWGIAAAAAAAAAGVAQLANIKSANPGRGGSAPSLGGASVSSDPAQAAPSQSLTIALPAGRYTHEEVMQIIEGINERVSNGATLISTKIAA